MDIVKKIKLGKLVRKPDKQTVIIAAVILVVVLAVPATGYIQARQATNNLDNHVGESSHAITHALEEATKAINSSETSVLEAIEELKALSQDTREKASSCDDEPSPLVGFIRSEFEAALNACNDLTASALQLADTVDSFIVNAQFMIELEAAVRPALKAAPSGKSVKPANLASAWAKAESQIAKIDNLPPGVERAVSKLRAAAKDIAKHAKTVESAQNNRDVAGFETANKAVMGAYVDLNAAGGELHSILSAKQQKLLEAAGQFGD